VLGAIFLQEMLVAGRRQRSYFLRWVYAFVLLVQLVPWVLAGTIFEAERPGSSALSVYGRFLGTFTAQHFFYLFALTPALAAGAIADEKMRGTLDYLLTTCLHPAEIVLGKLLARVCQVLAVALVALPIVCFFGVVSDMDFAFVVTLVAASVVLIVGVAALSLLASVWCRRTRDAVLCTYLAMVAGVMLLRAASAAGWDAPAEALSPWNVTAPEERDGRWQRLAGFSAAWLAPASVCAAVASWRLRSACTVAVSHRPRRFWRWARSRVMPEVANPVRWRERCVEGMAPLARLRAIPIWLAVPLVALGCAAGLALPVWWQLPPDVDLRAAFEQDGIGGLHEAFRLSGVRGWDVATSHGSIAVFMLTLLLAVRASGSITEEREQGTWDALLLTPITTREIVRGKFWGVQAACAPYVIAYAAGTASVALLINFHALVAAILTTAAIVVFSPWVAAIGVFCSAFSRSSWRSLLASLGFLYGSLVVAGPLFYMSCFLAAVVALLASLVIGRPPGNPVGDDLFILVFVLVQGGTTLSLVGLIAWPITFFVLLSAAQGRIDKRERAHVTRREEETMRLIPRLEALAEELADEQRQRDLERS
jgi:ABC-type transport system involved in multi-copper enzyme maturation permease subunit